MNTDNTVLLQHFNNLNFINKDIYNRNIPSQILQPNFSPRSLETRYRKFPILDNKKNNVQIDSCNTFNTHSTFYPGNEKPHFNGFASNIDQESILRSQIFALQKGEKHVYVPSSNSDLYVETVNEKSYLDLNQLKNQKEIDKKLLEKELHERKNMKYKNEDTISNSNMFIKEEFDSFNPNLSNTIGSDLFYNNTRVQLKNLN